MAGRELLMGFGAHTLRTARLLTFLLTLTAPALQSHHMVVWMLSPFPSHAPEIAFRQNCLRPSIILPGRQQIDHVRVVKFICVADFIFKLLVGARFCRMLKSRGHSSGLDKRNRKIASLAILPSFRSKNACLVHPLQRTPGTILRM